MDNKTLSKVTTNVYRQFPEMRGTKPKVEKGNRAQSKAINGAKTFLLVFKKTISNPKGRKIPRQVRVVTNDKGKILRISTSR